MMRYLRGIPLSPVYFLSMNGLKMYLLAIVLPVSFLLSAREKPLIHLRYEDNYTPAYYEVIDMYKALDAHYKNAALIEKGSTDSGKPLHLFVINNVQEFNPAVIKAQGKAVLLINSDIHAGEPAGIDAIYNSEWAEKSHRRYPAGKLFQGISKEMLHTD